VVSGLCDGRRDRGGAGGAVDAPERHRPERVRRPSAGGAGTTSTLGLRVAVPLQRWEDIS
jgi:hypothetical protein